MITRATRDGTLLQFLSTGNDDDYESVIQTLAREKRDGRRLIFDAVCSGNVDVAKYVLSLVDDPDTVINDQDDIGWTPLMSACSCNRLDMVDWLLSMGADATKLTVQKRSALFYAASKGSGQLVQKVLDAWDGDLLESTDSLGCTVFHRAVSSGNMEALRVLVLHASSSSSSSSFTEEDGGTITAVRDANGETVLDIVDRYLPDETKHAVLSLLEERL